METIIHSLLDWSEVWAPLIPLPLILLKKNSPPYLKPVRIYVWLALFFGIAADLIWRYKEKWGAGPGDFFWSNNFVYNVHSIIRFFLFVWFFFLLRQRFMPKLKAILPVAFTLFIIINFAFYEPFFNVILSSRLLATEAALLLFYCLQYYIFLMMEDSATRLTRRPGFWVVTGLTIYVAVNFFIFLFYAYLTETNINFAIKIWDVHNIVFILLCIFLAIAFNQKHEN